VLGGFKRICPINVLHPTCSCIEEQALLLGGICVDDVWDACDILKVDEARALRSVNMNKNVSDSFNAGVCVAKRYQFIVQRFVVDES